MGIGRFFGVLATIGLVGGCLGLFDEATGSVPAQSSTTSSVARPVRVPVGQVQRTVPASRALSPSSSTPSTDSRGPNTTAWQPKISGSNDEIDCERAEELADWGHYEAGDIADYCNYWTDPGELPDEFDWDE